MEDNVNLSQRLINEDENIISTSKKEKISLDKSLEIENSNYLQKDDSIIKIKKKENEARRPQHILRTEIFIWINIIMTIAFLCIPVINFCIFSIPYILFGLIRLFLLLSYTVKNTIILEIIALVYSFLLGFIIKSVLFLTYKDVLKSDEQNSSIIQLFGINSNYYITFGNDLLICLISFLSIIVKKHYSNKKLDKHFYYSTKPIKVALWCLLISVIGFNSSSISIISLVILFCTQIILITFNKSKTFMFVLKVISYINICALFLLYVGITTMNTFSVLFNTIFDENKKVLELIGIVKIELSNYSNVLYYVCLSISIVFEGLVIKRINQYEHSEQIELEKEKKSKLSKNIIEFIGIIITICWMSYYHIILSIIVFIWLGFSFFNPDSKKIKYIFNSICLFLCLIYINVILGLCLMIDINTIPSYVIIDVNNCFKGILFNIILLPMIYHNKVFKDIDPIENLQPIEKEKYDKMNNNIALLLNNENIENKEEEKSKSTLFKRLLLKYLIFQ